MKRWKQKDRKLDVCSSIFVREVTQKCIFIKSLCGVSGERKRERERKVDATRE
jgi:hypothetical protein